MNPYVRLYNVGILDDLHNYFPAFLYDQGQFLTLTDVFRYMNQQMYSQFNLFTRGYNEYIRMYPPYVAPTPPPAFPRAPTTRVPAPTIPTRQPTVRTTPAVRNPVSMTTTTETIDITPLFTTYLNPGSTFRRAPTGTTPIPTGNAALEALLSMINGSLLDPVVVRPTENEVAASTNLRQAVRADEQENCAICQEHYTEGQAIRTLNHCHHAFHKGCIDPWFERNVHCPVCRHDIREEATTTDDL